jgi:hypothetical protein
LPTVDVGESGSFTSSASSELRFPQRRHLATTLDMIAGLDTNAATAGRQMSMEEAFTSRLQALNGTQKPANACQTL